MDRCFFTRIFCFLFVSLTLACGSEDQKSLLKSPTPLTYRYNAEGGGSFNGAFLSQLGTRSGTSLVYGRQVSYWDGNPNPPTETESGCIVYGPSSLTLGVPSGGGSHAHAIVKMAVTDGTVQVDIASNGRALDSKLISANFDGDVMLDVGVFYEPLHGVEVRVCNPTLGPRSRVLGTPPEVVIYRAKSNVVVRETQIWFN